ncbi:cache domain-containing protein [Duganella sp. Dugasp56]|uniref:cache domain-containing protein n=1 Tax=Duganella sp. Dugasp56 TaxID=3243046 RepID=UPI0039AEB05B
MNKRSLILAAGIFLSSFLLAGTAIAETHASKEDAVAMVKKAVALIKKNGREKAFAVFNDPQGEFVDRELYVSVFDFDGLNLAHGANKKIIGKNLMEYRDPDGKYPIKECLALARGAGSGWVEFKFLNPVTKDMQSKVAYVERFEDLGVWVGAYK